MSTSHIETRNKQVSFEASIRQAISNSVKKMDFFWKVVNGEASIDELRKGASHYYAEVSVFIDLKLPERLRICPKEAVDVRHFFYKIYEEEHGKFVPDRDHASMWKKFCKELGVSDEELEKRRSEYASRYDYMRELEPSLENMLTELAIMTAWESVGPTFANLPRESLTKHYNLPVEVMEFFDIHSEDDIEHSSMAMQLLLKYANTEQLQSHALKIVRETLTVGPYVGLDY